MMPKFLLFMLKNAFSVGFFTLIAANLGWAKNGTIYLYSNNFIKPIFNFFTVKIKTKFVVKLLLRIPPHRICVVTLPCKISDIVLKPATTLTYSVTNVA